MKLRLMVGALVTVVSLLAGSGAALAEQNTQAFLLNSPQGSETTTVTAVGVFNGVGREEEVSSRFNEGRNGRFTFAIKDSFVFKEGNLFLSIRGAGRTVFNEETCAGRGSGRASYRITNGTGIFDDARGAGRATFDFAFIGEKVNGECVEEDGSGVFFAKLLGTLRLRGSMAA